MKRQELLQHFTEDQLRGMLVGTDNDPDDPNLDIDMTLSITNLKTMDALRRDFSVKYYEHIAHVYDKKKCECIGRSLKHAI